MPSVSLSSLLFKFINSVDIKRSLEEYIHVSDLFDGCMRQIFLAKQEGTQLVQRISPDLRLKFEVGNAMEIVVRKWMEKLGIFEEAQPLLKDDNLKIVGHPDLRLKNGQLVEIKALDPARFRLVKYRPLAPHEFQVQTYLWLDRAKEAILFMLTWGSEKNPFHDLPIRYNIKVGEAITKTVSSLREAEAGGRIPPRVCKAIDEKRALVCPVRERCFGEESLEVVKTAGQMVRGTLDE